MTVEQSLPQVNCPEIQENSSALRILLAEDSPTNQLIATYNLEQAGYVVEVVDDGQKAVQALGEGDFDLVLMDVFMPQMDGLEATQVIRQQEKDSGCHVPIIAMTGTDTLEHRAKCLKAGMDAFISKPVIISEFHEVLASFLPSHRNPRVRNL
ncbi:MAG: response regulator [Chloroflexi bacterium]|nr:response regulator [Chloroflexota bacterium]